MVLEAHMSNRTFYYRWEYDLKASPQQLWPYLTDTNRFNYDVGIPSTTTQVDPQNSLDNNRRLIEAKVYGFPLAWVEEPFEWVQPYRFGVVRHYKSGSISLFQPLLQMRTLAELRAKPDGGTYLVYETWVKPRHVLGYVAIPVQIGFIFARRFTAVIHQYDQLATAKTEFYDVPTTDYPEFPPGGRERLANIREAMVQGGNSAVLVDLLVQTIEQADNITLDKLRPYALAEYWKTPRRDVLELCLTATRAGLLDMQWDLLCPMCRGAKASVTNLSDVNRQVHCDACHIDYTANFDRSVELTFRPNPSIRAVPEQVAYCMAGPQTTPHIAVQQLLLPGEKREVAPELEAGRYRVRTVGLPGGQFLQVGTRGQLEAVVLAGPQGWSGVEQDVLPTPRLLLQNLTAEEQLFILERLAWTDTAATAAEVTSLQRFRDLFAEEALRPGDQIAVGSLTILFTDLVDSTRMYREIGDAPAFGLVMSHFDVLRQVIAEEDGAIVKTIGDAVMAVFRRPISALRAILAAQEQLMAVGSGERPLRLKAAIHYGPCIAVALNDRLDYFGSTVNVASRLEKFASGNETVISHTVYADPEVQALMAQSAEHLVANCFEERLKGYDEQTFMLWRVKMK